MISRIGPLEIALAFGIALIVFGPGKLPEVGKAFGRGMREFKEASRELTQSVTDADEEKS